jgi:hypothetical protein
MARSMPPVRLLKGEDMEDSILNFMKGEISKYIIPDIQRLIALRPQGSEGTASWMHNTNCNVAFRNDRLVWISY